MMVETTIAVILSAGALTPAQCSPGNPSDPLVAIQPVVRQTPSGLNSQNGSPPSSDAQITIGTFFMELWAQQLDPTLDGLNCVFADVAFNGALAACVADAVPSPSFGQFATGTCGAGTVDEMGGCTLTFGLGVTPEWRRIAMVEMSANSPGAVNLTTGQSNSGVSIQACGLVPASRITFGSAAFDIIQPCQTAAECADGDLCNGVETCNASGLCVPGTPVSCSGPTPYCNPQDGVCYACVINAHCDDLNACTTDLCSAASHTCQNIVTITCDDADPCTQNICNPVNAQCSNPPVNCDDGEDCNADSCDAVDGCVHDTPSPVNLIWQPGVVPILAYACNGETSPPDLGQACSPDDPGACSAHPDDCESQPFNLNMVAVPTEPGVDVTVFGVEAVMRWEPDKVKLEGFTDATSPYNWLLSGFRNDSGLDNLNEGIDVPPLGLPFNDGDALYTAQGNFNPPIGIGPATVPPGGLVVATFTFVATDVISSSVDIVESLGQFSRTAVIWGGNFICPTTGDPCNPNEIQPCGPQEICSQSNSVPGCELQNVLGSAQVLGTCSTIDDCGDIDGNGIVDDVCFWYECLAGHCNVIERVFGDAGGAFGVCPADLFANIHDANHALSCFSGINTCELLNIDLGGAFGSCVPDGFCNIHDANHALSAFSSTTTCGCPQDQQGAVMAPQRAPTVTGHASLSLSADQRVARPGSTVTVRAFIDDPLDDLRSYQLDVEASGGRRGALVLTDVSIERRRDHVFYGQADAFDAFNVSKGQMLGGLRDSAGVATMGPAYLATYTYRVSDEAVGTFVIDVRSDRQTYLVASNDGKIEVESTSPAVVTVVAPASDLRSR